MGRWNSFRMFNRPPFLSGFRSLLFGRRPVSAEEKILRERAATDRLCATQLRTLFGRWLPLALLHAKKKSGVNSRHSVFTPAVTFWAFLGQVVDPGSSCEKALSRVQALGALQGRALPSSATGADCTARARLSVRWLGRLCAQVAGGLMGAGGEGRLLVADGTGVSLPDTAALRARHPQPGAQKPGCGFPHLKRLGLFDLRSGAWLATIHSHLRVHDLPLLRRLFHRLRRGDTLLVDRAFCGWFDLARLQAKGVDLVVRLHQARRAVLRCDAATSAPARVSGATTTPSPGPNPCGPARWMSALTPRCPPACSCAKCAPGGNARAFAPRRSSSSPRCWMPPPTRAKPAPTSPPGAGAANSFSTTARPPCRWTACAPKARPWCSANSSST